MAEDVSILSEIDEALRADKLQAFWARNSGAVLTFCVMAVLATAASVFWKDHLHKIHEEQTALLTKATPLVQAGKYDEAITLYTQAEKEGGGLGALAAISHANALVSMRQEDKALEVYENLAAGKIDGTPDALRDYGALAAKTLTDNKALAAGKPPTAVTGAKDAAANGRAFSSDFAETDGLAALASGDEKTAGAKLNAVMNDDTAPFSARIRAAELLDSVKEEKPVKETGK